MTKQLPDDLIVEILCRLPVKTVMVMKLVSKTWHHLISNVCAPRLSAAAAAHPSGFSFRCCITKLVSDYECFFGFACYPGGRGRGRGRDCDGNSDGFVDAYSKLLPFQQSSNDFSECCNGLLLFIRGGVKEDPEYYVCNPTTKQCVAIPKPQRYIYSFSAALAFDPSKSPHYKVVRFLYTAKYRICCPSKLDIFSSETGKWIRRRVNLSIELPVEDHYGCVRRAIYLDEKLYKLVYFPKYLLRFDLKSQRDVAIELPLKNATNGYGFIGASKGSLYYSNHDESKSIIFVWLLEDHCKDGPFWTLKHCISMDCLMSKYPACRIRSLQFNAYAIHPTADIIFLGIPNVVVSYDLKSNKLEEAFRMTRGRQIAAGQYSVRFYSPCYIVLSDFGNKPVEFVGCKQH